MKVREPKVKQSANFCGRTVINGKPTTNPKKKNRPDKHSKAQNTYKNFKKNVNKNYRLRDEFEFFLKHSRESFITLNLC